MKRRASELGFERGYVWWEGVLMASLEPEQPTGRACTPPTRQMDVVAPWLKHNLDFLVHYAVSRRDGRSKRTEQSSLSLIGVKAQWIGW
jgi:hypothetical protein